MPAGAAERTRSPPLGRALVRRDVHAGVGRGQAARTAGGQPGGDGPAREDVGVGGQHVRRHGAARRQAGEVDAPGVAAVQRDGLVHHLLDRQCLATAASAVARLEPVETGVGVVDAARLRQDQRESVGVGELGPAGVRVVVVRALRAAVQGDDQRGAGRQCVRRVGVHRQVAGVGAETGDLSQTRGGCLGAHGEQTARQGHSPGGGGTTAHACGEGPGETTSRTRLSHDDCLLMLWGASPVPAGPVTGVRCIIGALVPVPAWAGQPPVTGTCVTARHIPTPEGACTAGTHRPAGPGGEGETRSAVYRAPRVVPTTTT